MSPKRRTQAWLSDEELHEAIRAQNPWWTTAKVPPALVKPFRRSAFYEALRFVDNGTSDRAVMILGARRVGKTSILYQLVHHLLSKVEPKAVLLLSLDHPFFQFPNLRKLLEHAGKCAGVSSTDFKYILLDEIQYTQDWARWLKTFVQEPVKRRIVVTGSAAAALQERGPDEGVGRWIDVHVPTLSLSEFTILRGSDLGPPGKEFVLTDPESTLGPGSQSDALLREEFEQYLLRGGFPELANRKLDTETAQRFLSDDIAEKVLNRDMAALFKVRQLLSLKQIFLAVAFRSSDIIDRRKLSEDFQVTPPTVNQYLKYLQLAFLIRMSQSYSPSERRIVRSHPKIYVADSGLRNAVMLRGEALLNNPVEMGPVVETAVFNQVFTWAHASHCTVYYWRNPQRPNREVDIVVCTQEGGLIPIEVKYTNEISGSDFNSLGEFLDRFDSRTISGYLLTKLTPGETRRSVRDREICVMSAHEFIWRLSWAAADPHVAEYLSDDKRIWLTSEAPASMPATEPSIRRTGTQEGG